jgi:hypothetical protein
MVQDWGVASYHGMCVLKHCGLFNPSHLDLDHAASSAAEGPDVSWFELMPASALDCYTALLSENFGSARLLDIIVALVDLLRDRCGVVRDCSLPVSGSVQLTLSALVVSLMMDCPVKVGRGALTKGREGIAQPWPYLVIREPTVLPLAPYHPIFGVPRQRGSIQVHREYRHLDTS